MMNTRLRHLDLNLLWVFDALMQERHLSRAATRLHMSQPAVSNALARLRSQLGESLFTRTARGMQPTPQALELHTAVRQALHLLQTGLSLNDQFDTSAPHTFRLSMGDYVQAKLLPVLMQKLSGIAPHTTLSIQTDEAHSLPRRLETGELDLAIDYLHFDNPELCYAPLLQETTVVIARPGHPTFTTPISVGAFEAAQHVALGARDGRGGPLEILLGSARLRRQVQLYLPHYLPIPAIVAQTDLLGTVPLRLARQFAPLFPLQMSPLPVPMSVVQISMMWHRRQDKVPGLRWLREQISAMVAEDAAFASPLMKV